MQRAPSPAAGGVLLLSTNTQYNAKDWQPTYSCMYHAPLFQPVEYDHVSCQTQLPQSATTGNAPHCTQHIMHKAHAVQTATSWKQQRSPAAGPTAIALGALHIHCVMLKPMHRLNTLLLCTELNCPGCSAAYWARPYMLDYCRCQPADTCRGNHCCQQTAEQQRRTLV